MITYLKNKLWIAEEAVQHGLLVVPRSCAKEVDQSTDHIRFDCDELVLVGGLDKNGEWRDFNQEDIQSGNADEFLADRAARIKAERGDDWSPFVVLK